VTQNPVDLDYKGLSNSGTWFIGRLQTERDKARVLEGLEGIAAGTGQKFNRQETEQILAGLSNRIFLLKNVHEDGTEVFQTRWAMSYLRGPLTRNQIKTLMDPIKAQAKEAAVGQAATVPAGARAQPAMTTSTPSTGAPPIQNSSAKTRQPVLSSEISQYFIPLRSAGSADSILVYHPMVIAAADIHFSEKRVDFTRGLTLLAPITDGPPAIDWNQASDIDLPISDLEPSAQDGAQFAELPGVMAKSRSYDSWRKDFAAWLYRNQTLELLRSARLDRVSNPEETERDFRVRLQQAAREQRDETVERLRQKYALKIAALEERRRRSQQAVEREVEQAKGQKMQTAISFGATLLSSFLGRKSLSLTTLGRATTAARGVGRSMKEAEDVERAEETVAAVSKQIADLDEQFKTETAAIETAGDPQTETLESITVKPTKSNIGVKLLSLAWVPYWHDSQGSSSPAWH
jgi:hypothetical protein